MNDETETILNDWLVTFNGCVLMLGMVGFVVAIIVNLVRAIFGY